MLDGATTEQMQDALVEMADRLDDIEFDVQMDMGRRKRIMALRLVRDLSNRGASVGSDGASVYIQAIRVPCYVERRQFVLIQELANELVELLWG